MAGILPFGAVFIELFFILTVCLPVIRVIPLSVVELENIVPNMGVSCFLEIRGKNLSNGVI